MYMPRPGEVILATVPDESRVLQVTVNHGMWEEFERLYYVICSVMFVGM